MVSVRAATPGDRAFLEEVLTWAADWRPGTVPRAVPDLLADPHLAHYVTGWPRPGDFGVVAEDAGGVPLGAAWCRRLPATDPGYGFVSADVPELSIGVRAGHRGRGVGRVLVDELLAAARRRGIEQVSLSVETDNPAVGLYASVGFVVVAEAPGSATMVVRLT